MGAEERVLGGPERPLLDMERGGAGGGGGEIGMIGSSSPQMKHLDASFNVSQLGHFHKVITSFLLWFLITHPDVQKIRLNDPA